MQSTSQLREKFFREEEKNNQYVNEDIFCGDVLGKIPKNRMGEKKYRNIGALKLNNTKLGPGFGSGVLISRDLVLTAAHNVYQHESREINHNIEFYPGQCG